MSSVLYDAPGPRARRNSLVATVVVGLLLAALVVLALVQLGANGQLDGEKWGPLYNPANPFFVAAWTFLGNGLVNTLLAAVITLVLSMIIGTALAVARISSSPAWRWLVVSVIEVFRGLPVVITIYFASRVLPEIGISLPPLWYLVIGLTAYNCVIIAEIIRAGVAALPRGQSEAALAVGLTRFQVLRMILLPQAFRIMLPALISQLVVIVKDTSLGFFVFNFEEFVRAAQLAVQAFLGAEGINLPVQMYITVALVFILINYGLSKLAEYVQRRTSRTRKAAKAKEPELVDTGAVGGA